MTNRRLKKPVLYGIYISVIFLVLGTIYLVEGMLTQKTFKDGKQERPTYVSDTIFSDDIPVVGTDTKIGRPYTDKDVKIIKSFYDYNASAETQIGSILYYENTYLQNSGASYGGKDNFEVVAILDGKVIDVKEDSMLGNIVEIEHNNEMISVYQSLGEVTVKKGDSIKQGTVIGKSGTNNIASDLGSHLDLELIVKGQNVNPESYYDKSISEI